jgi:hypothetical protein
MEEQVKHLENLINQKNSTLSDINLLENNLKIKKELLLKIQGVIEYLTQIGVSLTTENTENSSTGEEKQES